MSTALEQLPTKHMPELHTPATPAERQTDPLDREGPWKHWLLKHTPLSTHGPGRHSVPFSWDVQLDTGASEVTVAVDAAVVVVVMAMHVPVTHIPGPAPTMQAAPLLRVTLLV